MGGSRRAGALALGLCFAATGALGEVRAEQPADAPGREGSYRGVAPGDGGETGERRRCRGDRRATPVTWIGFQPRGEGGSRVFVQLCGEVTYDQELVDGRLLVTLRGAAHTSRNSRRPLDTRFFDGPLAGVRSAAFRKRRGGESRRGVVLDIRFKDGADPRPGNADLRREPDGYTYLYLDF